MDRFTDGKELLSSTKCKTKSLRCGDNDDRNSEPRIPHDTVIEVLKRLPVKSLMRFKCVSKRWHSTISDSGFADGLLITFTDVDASSQPGQPIQRFIRVSSDKTLHHQASISLAEHDMTQAINGLVCIYDNTDNLIFLCNIFTRENLELPSPRLDTRRAKYYFGYDPIKDLYKLLKICSDEVGDILTLGIDTPIFRDGYPCEILTLGVDSSWRVIPPATLDLKTQSICIDGVLYWGRDCHPNYSVVAFDLMEEEFRVEPIPDYMTETNKWNRFNVMELGGRLTLAQVEACLFDDGKLILWEFHDHQVGWTKHIVELPTELSEEGCRFPVGSLPTGELLLADYRLKSPMSVYSYDREKGKFEKFLMAEFPSSLALVCREAKLGITYHKGNFPRLDHMIKGCNSLSSYVPLSDRHFIL
ncbi:putative F-box protein At1g32420 [Olea europaea var. sylvestris]|uniref:F-box At5g65850-like n=1 Tax=Olea europaea subsp. europaea TaxID=158383 RepID=A0A8S0QF41_OLEEU|nr:putative F-box protein At1g32420 [Olea europaea var. sylvestris]CAA2965402.1 F-box At5g65850-like [Olea europaea subsp. europaea]